MNDGQMWTAMGVISTLAWTAVAVLMLGMWVALLLGDDPLVQAFGFTGCTSSAVAAVLHMRRYAVRQMALIRALHTQAEISDAELRGLRPIK